MEMSRSYYNESNILGHTGPQSLYHLEQHEFEKGGSRSEDGDGYPRSRRLPADGAECAESIASQRFHVSNTLSELAEGKTTKKKAGA